MNALGAIETCLPADAWDAATEKVNAWRGAALQCFAQAEWAVSQTLAEIWSLSPDKSEKPHYLFRQRFELLRSSVGAEGAFAALGGRAAEACAAFAPHVPLRAWLSHGVATVALDRYGHWIVKLTFCKPSSDEGKRESCAYAEREAEILLADLSTAAKNLGSGLQSRRDRIKRP
jgi:hypothetical protein